MRQILSGLATVIKGAGALRTHGGDAHGREKGYARIDARPLPKADDPEGYSGLKGIRVDALISLKIRHIDLTEKSATQNPREVVTKFGKSIDTFFANGLEATDLIWHGNGDTPMAGTLRNILNTDVLIARFFLMNGNTKHIDTVWRMSNSHPAIEKALGIVTYVDPQEQAWHELRQLS